LFSTGKRVFEESVLPKLPPPQEFTPQVFAAAENIQMIVVLQEKLCLLIPKTLPTAYWSRGKGADADVFFLDDLLVQHVGPVFGMKGRPALFRVTRDADVTVEFEELDATSFPDVIRSKLSSRDKGGRAVRLQHRNASKTLVETAAQALKIKTFQCLEAHT